MPAYAAIGSKNETCGAIAPSCANGMLASPLVRIDSAMSHAAGAANTIGALKRPRASSDIAIAPSAANKLSMNDSNPIATKRALPISSPSEKIIHLSTSRKKIVHESTHQPSAAFQDEVDHNQNRGAKATNASGQTLYFGNAAAAATGHTIATTKRKRNEVRSATPFTVRAVARRVRPASGGVHGVMRPRATDTAADHRGGRHDSIPIHRGRFDHASRRRLHHRGERSDLVGHKRQSRRAGRNADRRRGASRLVHPLGPAVRLRL